MILERIRDWIDAQYTEVQAAIKKVDANISEVNDEIKELIDEIKGCRDAAMQQQLREKEKLLRQDRLQLRDEKSMLQKNHALLLERKLQHHAMSGSTKHKNPTTSAVAFQEGDADPSRAIVTYDAFTSSCASGFVASSMNIPQNCAFNGICLESFNITIRT